ncbi:MAG: hypothetical protein ACOH5I_26430 [Oligoflexus sp.]
MPFNNNFNEDEDIFKLLPDAALATAQAKPLSPRQPAPAVPDVRQVDEALMPDSIMNLTQSADSEPLSDLGKFPMGHSRPGTTPTPNEPQATPSGKDWGKLIEGLRQQGKDQTRAMMILKGLQQMVTAPARSVGRSDYSKYDNAFDNIIKHTQGTAERGIADVLQQRQFEGMDKKDAEQQEMSDPASELSKAYQETASKFMPERDFSKFNAKTLATQMPFLQSQFQQAAAERLARQKAAAAAQPKQSEAQKAVDREFGKEYVDWTAKGGYADAEKQIGQIREVRDGLLNGDYVTGPVSSLMPDAARKRVMPDSFGAQERVEEVVQRNLRLILGPQFTEKEGERLISRAYNPALDEKENAARLDAIIKQMKGAAQAKEAAAKYYEENGTLVGYTGPSPREAAGLPENMMNAQDEAALEWAQANQDDPRARSIVEKLRKEGKI